MTAVGTDSLARNWIVLAGVVLVLVGLLGFIANPLVGRADALIPTGTVHNIVHLVTGVLALYIGFMLKGVNLVNGVIGFGILYVVILVAVLISPTLFGLFDVAANIYLHVIHAALAVVSLGVGYMARNSATAR
jgi:hypothetical protein